MKQCVRFGITHDIPPAGHVGQRDQLSIGPSRHASHHTAVLIQRRELILPHIGLADHAGHDDIARGEGGGGRGGLQMIFSRTEGANILHPHDTAEGGKPAAARAVSAPVSVDSNDFPHRDGAGDSRHAQVRAILRSGAE